MLPESIHNILTFNDEQLKNPLIVIVRVISVLGICQAIFGRFVPNKRIMMNIETVF